MAKAERGSAGAPVFHQRNVVHGNLQCNHIVVGANPEAKLAGFGENRVPTNYLVRRMQTHWKAPELFRDELASSASDVYAFGMCILEAVSLDLPWKADYGFQIIAKVLDGKLPYRPVVQMSQAQYELVDTMCAFDPSKRVTMMYVVTQLKAFAVWNESAQDGTTSHSSYSDQTIQEFIIPELSTAIEYALQNVLSRCSQVQEARWMAEKAYKGLKFIYQRLVELEMRTDNDVVTRYCAVLCRFESYLRVGVSKGSVARLARSRQVAETHYVLYAELDRLLDMLNVPQTDPVRVWHHDKEDIESQSLVSHGAQLFATGSSIEGKKTAAVTLQHFDPYLTAAMSSQDSKRSASKTTPKWHLPLREVDFNTSDCIGEGSFGAVYKGSWMDTHVVVKFMGYHEDSGTVTTELFLHEVEVWHHLNHPHIIKLFGANHVAKRYFVCESASQGILLEYLESKNNSKFEMWQKLYEVALGLQYMHKLNIVHNDLKCDNILIGENGQAKIIDSGLSSLPNKAEIMVDLKKIGAVHWKSPEYLRGERPAISTNIYSFAMCILEVETGDVPWVRNMLAVMVRYRVKKGEVPARPETMSAKQWDLIERMTNPDPAKRMQILLVAAKLYEIAQDAPRPGVAGAP